MAKAKKQSSKKSVAVENPFRPNGGYWSVVESLAALGENQMHSFDKIVPAYKKAMGAEGWAKVAEKKGKLTPEEKAILNCSVVARADYGKPLREKTGWEVRFDGKAKEAGLFKI
jgi:hypothetical protein